jgi:hypothetical protein
LQHHRHLTFHHPRILSLPRNRELIFQHHCRLTSPHRRSPISRHRDLTSLHKRGLISTRWCSPRPCCMSRRSSRQFDPALIISVLFRAPCEGYRRSNSR